VRSSSFASAIPVSVPARSVHWRCGGGGWPTRGNAMLGHIDPYTTASLF
jgi:hypothetical protein